MARYTGPKFKLSRREGVNVTGTTSALLENVINTARWKFTAAKADRRLRAKQRVKEQYMIPRA